MGRNAYIITFNNKVRNIIMSIKVGDFVTAYGSGYWQLIDIKPKIATENYKGENVSWKKGDTIGSWVILKKAFTAKMKPRIDFSYEDASFLRPVSGEILSEINRYFEEHPDYRKKFDNAPMKLSPMITNCWVDLPKEAEGDFRAVIGAMPERYTMDEFWTSACDYKKYIVQNPPCGYLINLLTFPWDVNGDGDPIYHGCELTKIGEK